MLTLKIPNDSPQTIASWVDPTTNQTSPEFYISTNQLGTFLESILSAAPKDSDSGFLPPSLIRKVVKTGEVKHLFMYPIVELPILRFNFRDSEKSKIKALAVAAPDVFQVVGNCLHVKDIIFRDIYFYHRESSRGLYYKTTMGFKEESLGSLLSPCLENVKLLSNFLPNHYSDKICWPTSLADVSRSLLHSKDPLKLSRIPGLYLNTEFNTDLTSSNLFGGSFDSAAAICMLTRLPPQARVVLAELREWPLQSYIILALLASEGLLKASYFDNAQISTVGNLF